MAPGCHADIAMVGVDIGTSGVRAIALDRLQRPLAHSACALPPSRRDGACVTQNPADWWQAVQQSLAELFANMPPAGAVAIAVAGTSSTCLLCNASGQPLTPGLMYDDSRARAQALQITTLAGDTTPASDSRSSLSKLLWWHDQGQIGPDVRLLHQADWIAGCLCGRFDVTDHNNALKLGFDVMADAWPAWFTGLHLDSRSLPAVVAPGTAIGVVRATVREQFRLSPMALVTSGTTDSIAGFLAAGAERTGDAVTSLGSTLALKLVSEHPIYSAAHGVYSHRLGNLWLVGGASNAGGAALAQHFRPEEMDTLSQRVDPDQPTGLKLYPLPSVGERFPLADPDKRPVLTPRPADSAIFFQGLLEGLADIEAQGYALLARLGAGPVQNLWTSGRVGQNPILLRLRERQLGLRIRPSRFDQPAAGAALLAGCAMPELFEENLWRSSPILARLAQP